MANNELKVTIGADVSGLQRAEKQASLSLNKINSAATSAGASMQKVAPGANEAAFALTNVGRVAQDLPFGFMGIQNNLNPLLESFQRLKAQTGSTGLALRALGSSLAGAGGIGLALSVASSAFLIFQNGIMSFAKKTKEAKTATDELSESIRSSSAIQRDAAASVQSNILKVQSLAAIVRDTTRAYELRKNALNELGKENKKIFGDLTLEAQSLQTLTGKIEEYSKAVLAAAVTKEFSNEIAKAASNSSKLKTELEQATAELSKSLRAREQLNAPLQRNGAGFLVIPKNLEDLRKEAGLLDERNKKVADFHKALADIQRQTMGLNKGFNEALAVSTQFVDLFEKPQKSPTTDFLKQRISALKELIAAGIDLRGNSLKLKNLEIELMWRDGEKQGFSREEIIQLIQARYPEFSGDNLTYATPISVTVPIRVKSIIESINAADPAQDNLAEGISRSFNRIITVAQKDGKKAQKAVEAAINNVNQAITNTVANAGVSIGEAIGEAFSGQSPIASFLNVIATALQELGKALIAFGVAKKLAIDALKSLNPFVAIAAGTAAIAAGALLRRQVSNPMRLADGGITNGPTLAMIGEAGREAVIPLDRIESLISPRSEGIYVAESYVSGENIVQLWKTITAKNERMH